MSSVERLEKTLQHLHDDQPDDLRLRDNLEGLVRDEHFAELTWFWGPLLYQRNRVVFRGLILNHFSEWRRTKRRWKRIKWSDHADRLQAWLDAARKHCDTALVRRLLRWKYAAKSWGVDPKAWSKALLNEYALADSTAARAIVLDEYDDWFELTEDSALVLYQQDANSAAFILKHLPSSFWGEDKRKRWERLATAATDKGDDKLYFELYRRQIPIKRWQAEILDLARETQDPERLNGELEKRHPSGYRLKLGDALHQLLQIRGRDVMPYVRSKLTDIGGGWLSDNLKPLIDLAEQKEWWDLWSAGIRVGHDTKRFNRAVASVLSDTALSEAQRLARLGALAGVSSEWNWPGLGLVRVHTLDDKVATDLYQLYPALLHSAFKPHVLPTWRQGFPELLAAAQQTEDEALVDLLASRYVTQASSEPYYPADKALKRLLATAEQLGEYYQSLRDRDPSQFARRAANVLTRIPAYAIYNHPQLLKTNSLARLLFVRSFEIYLAVPESIRDLVEGSEIHVQMLAYRILAQDDERARQMAVETLDILLATLLRPLHRKTRIAAFDALLNAARASEAAADMILKRARESLRLPDKRYPKERLIGLIGNILHLYPKLRSADEQPIVYGRQVEQAA